MSAFQIRPELQSTIRITGESSSGLTDNPILMFCRHCSTGGSAPKEIINNQQQNQLTQEPRMKITLVNDFHNTFVNLDVEVLSHIHNVAVAYLSVGQIRKSKRELCGIRGCTCSGDVGTRGPQSLENGKRLEINCDSIYSN